MRLSNDSINIRETSIGNESNQDFDMCQTFKEENSYHQFVRNTIYCKHSFFLLSTKRSLFFDIQFYAFLSSVNI